MTQATISSKNQIVIPREAREALDLKAGDKVLVVVRGKRVLLLQKPVSHRAALRGMARNLYPSQHVQKERQSWE
jgi:AbrB family looped-hinge helix DNA binding protein